ncbi:GNAT family N-acetyltransferase [Salinicoccus sp. Marseille-QA3877]
MNSVQITEMKNEHVDQAAGVIAKSFQTEEFAKNTFDFSDSETEGLFTELLKIELKVFKKHGEKVDVALYNGNVAGVFSAKVTDDRHGFSMLKQLLKNIRKVLPVAKRVKYKNLFKMYRAMQKPDEIPEDAILLEMIAVSPEYQGRGVGKAMMNAIDDYSKAVSRPIYLYTANAENVDYYEKQGYKTLVTIKKKDFTAFHMLKDLR